jgi:hypothetical protein
LTPIIVPTALLPLPNRNFLTNVSFTMATLGVPRTSPAVNSRPDTSGIPIV